MLRSVVKHNPKKPHKSPLKINKCSPITDFSYEGKIWIKKLISDMKDTCTSMKGVGLAANQIGVYRQLILIAEPKKPHIIMINPRVIDSYGDIIEEKEGCLSVPGVYGIVKRHQYVVVEFKDINGDDKTSICCGYEARIVSHEIGHLNNELCIERFEK